MSATRTEAARHRAGGPGKASKTSGRPEKTNKPGQNQAPKDEAPLAGDPRAGRGRTAKRAAGARRG